MCDAAREAVVECADASSIYEVPPTLHRGGMDTFLVQRPGLTLRDADWTEWNGLRERVHNPSHRLEVALVGKYVDLHDAYPSVSEAIRHAGFTCDARVDIRWIASSACETPEGAQRALAGVDAVVVPGGFGVRGDGAGDARSRGHADGGAVRVRHRGRRPGRHDAPRCLPGGPGRGIAGRSGLRGQAGHRKA